MLIKAVRAGAGSPALASDYVMRKGKYTAHKDEAVSVLRGDPSMFVDVAENLDFVQKYTSSVIAFHPDDEPTAQQIEDVMNDFEKACFADMHPSRFCQSYVEHRTADAVHIHVLTARVDMQTRKSYNPMPPGWEKTFNLMAEAHNYKFGWVRPDDPIHARDISKGHGHMIDADAVRNGIEQGDNARELINSYVLACIEMGKIENRADIKNVLSEFGEITREAEKTISIRLPDANQNMKLRGRVYEREFNANIEAENTSENRERQSRAERTDANKSRQAEKKFGRRLLSKSDYNRQRYFADEKTAGIGVEDVKQASASVRAQVEQQASNQVDTSAWDTSHSDSDATFVSRGSSPEAFYEPVYNTKKLSGEHNSRQKTVSKLSKEKSKLSLADRAIVAIDAAAAILNSLLGLIWGDKNGRIDNEACTAIADAKRLNQERVEAATDANRNNQRLRSTCEELEAANRAAEQRNHLLDSADEALKQTLESSLIVDEHDQDYEQDYEHGGHGDMSM